MTWPKTILLAGAMLLSVVILACAFRYSAPVIAGGEAFSLDEPAPKDPKLAVIVDRWTGKPTGYGVSVSSMRMFLFEAPVLAAAAPK